MRMAQHFDAVNVRHLDVSDDDVVQRPINFVLGRLPRLHGLHAMSLAPQGNVEHFTNGALVVADQNISHATSLQRPKRLVAAQSSSARPCPTQQSPPPQAAPHRDGAIVGQTSFPAPAWNAPTPCLRAPAPPGKQWRDPVPYRLQSST